VGTNILGETGSYKQIPPIRFCQAYRAAEFAQSPATQFEGGKTKSLQGVLIGVLKEWQVVAALLGQQLRSLRPIRREEQKVHPQLGLLT
jgi:hypothetical protein